MSLTQTGSFDTTWLLALAGKEVPGFLDTIFQSVLFKASFVFQIQIYKDG